MSETPLVTVMIATKNRPGPLSHTLIEMSKQDYPSVEIAPSLDDGSEAPLEDVVTHVWPGAAIIRHTTSEGQCQRRNEGFQHAKGEFILQLDDDCSFTDPTDLTRAVRRLQSTGSAAAISFYIINAPALPEKVEKPLLRSGCVATFMGAAVLLRKAALDQTLGYRPFFRSESEEEELSLQLLNVGWEILFVPEIVAHHRLSPLNRDNGQSWMRGLRNRLLTLALHMPLGRLPLEFAWKFGVGAWDALRMLRFKLYLQALFETILGFPSGMATS